MRARNGTFVLTEFFAERIEAGAGIGLVAKEAYRGVGMVVVATGFYRQYPAVRVWVHSYKGTETR